ncbi:3328_t:CDS:2, partial [Gigaspora margarita]
ETIVDFYNLSNPVVANNAKVVVDHYYQHTCSNPQHQFKRFKKQVTETFGTFTRSISNIIYENKKLDFGPNVPKLFRGFPIIVINFNTICQFHQDLKDHQNIICVVCLLGSFEDKQLVFLELKLAIHAKQDQAIAFKSNILVHNNLPVIS